MFNMDDGAWEVCQTRDLVSESLGSIEKGVHIDADGKRLRGLTIFNVPIGEHGYMEKILRNKAIEVAKVNMEYVCYLEKNYPHELCTMWQYSTQHMVTYWLRTCTHGKTEEIDKIVEAAIIDAVHAATGGNFIVDGVAKDRLRLPARLKGGELLNMTYLRRPAFLGAILDTLWRCIDKNNKEPNGELMKRVYTKPLKVTIGQGAYDAECHRYAGFLQASNMGPFPAAMQSV